MSDLVVIWSMGHKAYWAQNSNGYRLNLSMAGLYSREEAQEIVDSSRGRNERIVEIDKAFTDLQAQAYKSDRALTEVRIQIGAHSRAIEGIIELSGILERT